MKDRLGSSDYRFIAVCFALLAATTWFSARNFFRAFPEASIDFRVSRTQGESIAAAFLAERQHNVAEYRRASSFTYDDEAKTFLEREAGPEQANRLLATTVRLWRWSYRWFRPLQKEEFRVDVTPRGELAGFRHELPEDAARPAVTSEEARAIAEEFLRAIMRRDPGALDFVEASETGRLRRTDRRFTWQERQFGLRDATYRIEVTLLGNEIGGYREHLKVPEQWTRDYQRLRSKNEAASTVDLVFMSGILVGLLIVIVMRVRGHDIRWRQAATVGVAGMALSFLAHLNQMPLQEFEYPTTDSYASFMLRQVLGGLVSALGAGGLLFVLTAGAEPMYREMFPGHIALGNLFRRRSFRTKRFFLGAVLGISLTGIFVAYQTGFYMAAYRFGAWSPADVPYSDLLNTRLPWAFVLFGGFLPAVSEEFLFRLFAIPFLRKLTRSIATAVVLAGFIWGFGHAGYPQQPFWIRGVEVGIGGVALGMVMLRWGILPTLIWHYSVDAMYTAMLLLRSQNLYLRLSGAASAGIVVLPLVVALVAYWRRGGFEPEDGLLNADESVRPAPATEPEVSTAETFRHREPLSARVRVAALALVCVAILIPVHRFGAAPAYRIPEEQALASADAFLRSRGLDPSTYRHVVVPAAHWDGPDELAAKYFLERKELPAASAMFERYRPIQHWLVRYFKPLSQDEAIAAVHPERGTVTGYAHTLPEDQGGPDLPQPEALRIASAFAAGFGWDTAGMELKESRSERKKARRDYKYVWEARDGDPRNVDEARFRVEVEVSGGEASSARGYWKVPEEYSRARERQNYISITTTVLRIAMLAAVLVAALLTIVRKVREGAVQWRSTLRVAIPAGILSLAAPLLSFNLMLQNYPTAIPLETFRATLFLGILMAGIFGFVVSAAAVALMTSLYKDVLPAFRPENRRALAADAAAALVAAIGLSLLADRLDAVLSARFHAYAILSIGAPTIIASAAPAFAAAANAIRAILVLAALLATAALLVNRAHRNWMRVVLGLLVPFALLPAGIRTPGEFALGYGVALMAAGAVAAFCRFFARDNYLAYAAALWFLALRGPLAELFRSPRQLEFWLLVAIFAGGLIWALVPIRRALPVIT